MMWETIPRNLTNQSPCLSSPIMCLSNPALIDVRSSRNRAWFPSVCRRRAHASSPTFNGQYVGCDCEELVHAIKQRSLTNCSIGRNLAHLQYPTSVKAEIETMSWRGKSTLSGSLYPWRPTTLTYLGVCGWHRAHSTKVKMTTEGQRGPRSATIFKILYIIK